MILLTNNEGTLGVPTTARLLAEGAHALDAIEAGIRLIEADPSVRTVGRGGWPNLLGEMELDACMMDGSTLRTGAVGALQGFLHPVSVAREIMRRLPHEFLVGDGAARFAREIGAEPADNLIEDSRRAWQAWFDNEVPEEQTTRVARHAARRAVPPCDRSGNRPRHHGLPGARRGGQHLFRYQHIRLGLEISRPPRRQPDHRRRFICRHALRRGRLHRRRRDDDTLLHRPFDRAVHEAGRQRRRCGRRGGRGHARPEGRPDQPRDDPRDRHEGQPQGGRGEWRRRQQVLAVGRAGRAASAAGGTSGDHHRRCAPTSTTRYTSLSR